MFKPYYFIILRAARKAVDKFYSRAEEKKRSVEPWKVYDYSFLFTRLNDEVQELYTEIYETMSGNGGVEDRIQSECLDIINFATFIYEKARQLQEGEG